jgi:hypothetical protein
MSIKATPLLPGQRNRPFLTPEQIKRLIDARNDGATFRELAERFRVSDAFVRRAVQRGAA